MECLWFVLGWLVGVGEVLGYYFDPECQPFQELELLPDKRGRSGFSFSHAQFV